MLKMLCSFPAANISRLRWQRAMGAVLQKIRAGQVDTLEDHSSNGVPRRATPPPAPPAQRLVRAGSAPAALNPALYTPPLQADGAALSARREFAPISQYLERVASAEKPLVLWQRVTLAVVSAEFGEDHALYKSLVLCMPAAVRRNPLSVAELMSSRLMQPMRIEVRHKLGQFLARKIDAVPLFEDGRLVPMVQRFSHLERSAQSVWRRLGGTLNSNAIKGDRLPENRAMLTHNANLGTLTWKDRVLLGRSARADTPERVQELLLNTAMAARDARGGWRNASGVHALGRQFEYRGAILTALDLSPRKHFFMWLTGGETERPMIAALQQSITSLFARDNHVSCKLEHGDAILLRKPVLLHLPLSQEATPGNIRRAHRFNRPAAMQMFQDLSAVWRQSQNREQREVGAAMALCSTDRQRRDYLRRLTPTYLDHTGLGPQQSLALDALRITVHHRDCAGQTYFKPTDPERELHAIQELLDQCNTVIHPQCKSGQDRTLTACSTLAARHRLQLQTGEFYDPRIAKQDAGIESAYNLAFTEVANALGANPIHDVRSDPLAGKQGKAKIRHKPIPDARYLPYSNALGLKKSINLRRLALFGRGR